MLHRPKRIDRPLPPFIHPGSGGAQAAPSYSSPETHAHKDKVHHDATQFWLDVNTMLALRNCDNQKAFAMGMAAAVGLSNGGFPTRQEMESAAARGPREYYRFLREPPA